VQNHLILHPSILPTHPWAMADILQGKKVLISFRLLLPNDWNWDLGSFRCSHFDVWFMRTLSIFFLLNETTSGSWLVLIWMDEVYFLFSSNIWKNYEAEDEETFTCRDPICGIFLALHLLQGTNWMNPVVIGLDIDWFVVMIQVTDIKVHYLYKGQITVASINWYNTDATIKKNMIYKHNVEYKSISFSHVSFLINLSSKLATG
jgi:hypothetical protein